MISNMHKPPHSYECGLSQMEIELSEFANGLKKDF